MRVVEAMIEAIRSEDIAAYGRLYSDDAVMHEPLLPEPARGRDAIVAGEESLFRAFGDITVDVKHVMSEGTHVLAEVVMHATNDGPLDLGEGDIPLTGRRVEVPMVWSLELDSNGLIVEEHDYFDPAIVPNQLGFGER